MRQHRRRLRPTRQSKRAANFRKRDAARHVHHAPGRHERAQAAADRRVPFLFDTFHSPDRSQVEAQTNAEGVE